MTSWCSSKRTAGISSIRVPTPIVFLNSLCFPSPTPNFPVSIYMICNHYIHKTDLADSLLPVQQVAKNKKIFFFLGGGGGGGETIGKNII